MTGIICSILTYVIYTVNPVNTITQYHLQITPHTFLFSMWKKPPLDVFLSVYVFNITNPVEFLSGKEKLKVQELGPYVYQEYLENHNVTFNDNDTMTYIPKRTIIYVPEKSVRNPAEDLITVPNIAYLGASSALHNAGFLVNYPLTQLATMIGAKPILNMSVHEYLWGYEDKLVSLASNIVPSFINFQKFGLLDRMYDEGENIVTINLRKNDNMLEEKGRYLSIDKFNGSPGLSQWGYVNTRDNETRKENTACNTIQGATEGIIFPSYMDKRAVFKVYRKAFCRALPIVFKKEVVTVQGLPGYLYVLKDGFADPPDQNPENECYCLNKKKCLKKGLMDLTPCYYNIPAAVSLPHFLDADPTLLENIEGLEPNREKHDSYVILQPTLGVPIQGRSRVQTNLILQHTRYNPDITAFNNLTVPLMWTEMIIPSLPLYLKIGVQLVLQVFPVVQAVLMYLLGVAGVTTIILSLIVFLRILTQQQKKKQEMIKTIDNSDLKIPLCNGQYSSINIFPTLKKITSKTDLFS